MALYLFSSKFLLRAWHSKRLPYLHPFFFFFSFLYEIIMIFTPCRSLWLINIIRVIPDLPIRSHNDSKTRGVASDLEFDYQQCTSNYIAMHLGSSAPNVLEHTTGKHSTCLRPQIFHSVHHLLKCRNFKLLQSISFAFLVCKKAIILSTAQRVTCLRCIKYRIGRIQLTR